MIQLYEEDNGLSIADRTVSLQYRKFRTPRKELKKLILDNKKTCLLSEAEIKKYEKYLNRNGDSNGNGNSDGNGNSNLKDKIYVDIEGMSTELSKRFGSNYLEGNCVLVSTKQMECDSIRKSYLGNYIKQIFKIHQNTIEQILMGEALIGTVNKKNVNMMIDNPESLFNVEIEFDTPNNAISKLKNIRKDERILLENEDKLKDRVFLKNLLQDIEDISEEHGSLDRIPDEEIDLKEKLDFNILHLDDIDIYCLKSTNGTNILIYFGDDDKEIYMKDDLIILNGKDINSLNVLMELGIVGYNPYLGLERAYNMILRNRKEKIENMIGVKQKRGFEKFDLNKNLKNIPEKARKLLAAVELLIKNNRNKDFFANLGQIRIYMTYPLIQNDILYELLTRMENDGCKSDYSNTEKFISIASNMNDEQLREFIEKILNSLEFEEENNTMTNMWLMENRENVCNDLGIEFIQN